MCHENVGEKNIEYFDVPICDASCHACVPMVNEGAEIMHFLLGDHWQTAACSRSDPSLQEKSPKSQS